MRVKDLVCYFLSGNFFQSFICMEKLKWETTKFPIIRDECQTELSFPKTLETKLFKTYLQEPKLAQDFPHNIYLKTSATGSGPGIYVRAKTNIVCTF